MRMVKKKVKKVDKRPRCQAPGKSGPPTVCGKVLPPAPVRGLRKDKVYCSNTCKQRAHYWRFKEFSGTSYRSNVGKMALVKYKRYRKKLARSG